MRFKLTELKTDELGCVTTVIPASRVPTSSKIEFWSKLLRSILVRKLIFVVNGKQSEIILQMLNTHFELEQQIEIVLSPIASATKARNLGLSKTETKYVHFLDDDDEILPSFYDVTVPILESSLHVGVAVSAIVNIDGKSNNSYSIIRNARTLKSIDLLVDNFLGVTSGVLLKTDHVKDVGGFDEDMPARQDYELWLRLSQLGHFRIISEPLLYWTENRKQVSIRNNTPSEKHLLAIARLSQLKNKLDFDKLPRRKQGRAVANHYKYLATMQRLNTKKVPWKYILLSLAAQPQAKVILMFLPHHLIINARKFFTRKGKEQKSRSDFSVTERKLADILSRFPSLKRLVKDIYRGFFYICRPEKKIKKVVHLGNLEKIIVPEAEEHETFFGYYDRIPENDTRHLIVHSLTSKCCQINILDADGNLTCKIPSSAWNYQQGTLANWVTNETVVFNDIIDGCLKTGFLNTNDGTVQYFNGSFQSVSSRGDLFASVNINLINKLRPEYGFAGQDTLYENDNQLMAIRSLSNPDEFLKYITLENMSQITNVSLPIGATKINHVTFSPNGSHLTFLLRYFLNNLKHTFQIIYDIDNDEYTIIECGRVISHYTWLNKDNIIVWGEQRQGRREYFLSNVLGETKTIIKQDNIISDGDGHPTVIPHTEFIISDTYPDKRGMSQLYKFSWQSGLKKTIGTFYQPFRFRGAKRIDLHPRYSLISNCVYFDSGHAGKRGAYKLTLPPQTYHIDKDVTVTR